MSYPNFFFHLQEDVLIEIFSLTAGDHSKTGAKLHAGGYPL
jgi:hypothetical protein